MPNNIGASFFTSPSPCGLVLVAKRESGVVMKV